MTEEDKNRNLNFKKKIANVWSVVSLFEINYMVL